MRNFPIRIQLILIIAVTSAITLVTACSVLLAYDLVSFRQRLISDMKVQADIIGDNSSAAASFGDKAVANEVLSSLESKPEVLYATLELRDGSVLASYSRNGKDPQTAIDVFEASPDRDHIITVKQMGEGSDRIGTLRVLSHLKEWYERRNTYLVGLLGLAFVALITSAVIGSYMQNLVSRPLGQVAATMSRVTETRDYSERMKVESRDEVGILVQGLNQMLAEIEEGTENLKREVRERHAKEAELEASRRQLAEFFQTAPLGLVRVDSDGIIIQVNRAEVAMLGFPEDHLVGRRLEEFTADPNTLRQALAELRSGEELADFEVVFRCGDGIERLVEISANGLYESGRLLQARLFTKDLTLIRQAEKDHEAKILAERANQAKTEFLSRMSHELRTPLNAILGFGQLLEMGALEPRQRECVEHILRGGRHLLSLINEVLNISKIESGDITVSVEVVHLGDVVREVLDLVRPLAVPRGITLHTEIMPDSPVCVQGDRQRLNQVLINLATNAIKYNVDRGEVYISAVELEGAVHIKVADTGLGIPVHLRSRLFVPFDRLGAEQTGVEGSGLGLAYSKALMEAQGGALKFNDEHEGAGSEFIVELKAARTKRLSEETNTADEGPKLELVSDNDDTILIIEDNEANVQLFEEIFADRPSTHLLIATQGALGIQFAERHRPDLLLLDANLPDLHGSEIARRLRANPHTKNTPIIVVSADATEHTQEQFKEFGIVAYLSKPVNIKELMKLTNQTLNERNRKSA